MKFATVAVLALASVAAIVQADVCPDTEISKLLALAQVASLDQCQKDAEYTFIPPVGAPDEIQTALLCSSDACRNTTGELAKLGPLDCEMSFSNGVTLNVKQILDNLERDCAAGARRL